MGKGKQTVKVNKPTYVFLKFVASSAVYVTPYTIFATFTKF